MRQISGVQRRRRIRRSKSIAKLPVYGSSHALRLSDMTAICSGRLTNRNHNKPDSDSGKDSRLHCCLHDELACEKPIRVRIQPSPSMLSPEECAMASDRDQLIAAKASNFAQLRESPRASGKAKKFLRRVRYRASQSGGAPGASEPI